jgi:Na+/citrate or Na+/malate symporter
MKEYFRLILIFFLTMVSLKYGYEPRNAWGINSTMAYFSIFSGTGLIYISKNTKKYAKWYFILTMISVVFTQIIVDNPFSGQVMGMMTIERFSLVVSIILTSFILTRDFRRIRANRKT